MASPSHRVVAIFALVALVVLFGTLLVRVQMRTEVEAYPAGAKAETLGRAAAEMAEAVSAPISRETLPIESKPAPQEPPPEAPAAELAAHVDPPPRGATGTLHILVIDALTAQAVPQATVQLQGLRRSDDRGSWYGWPGDPPSAETDVHGETEFSFPAWVHGLAPTSAVDVVVTHPEYTTLRDDSLTIASLSQRTVLKLERGAFLIVSGWIGSPSNVVRDVKPEVDQASELGPDAWLPVRDGRPSTSRLAPGEHAIAISWTSPEGALFHSRVEPFTLATGEQREIALELLSANTLEGRLDDAVPRPVKNGEVMVSVDFGSRGKPTSLRTWKAGVEADGTFHLTGLPPGTGQIIALCDGWVSRRVGDDGARANVAGQDPDALRRALESLGDSALDHPSIVIPATAPLIVPMERTTTLVVLVEDRAHGPIDGAVIGIWPNVHWRNGYSSLFLDRTWPGITDLSGRARIENLPPGTGESVEVRARGYRRVGGDGPHPDTLQVDLVAGETTEIRVEVEHSDS